MAGTHPLRALAAALLAWAAGSAVAPAQINGAAVRAGDVLVATPLPYVRTGRVQNDVVRSALGVRTPSLRAGTPVYQMTYHYDLRSAGSTLLQYHRPMWCGVSDGEGVCVVMFDDGARVARITAGSPHYPRELSRLMACNTPEVTEDSSLAATFPARELRYSVQRVRTNSLRLAVSVVVAGEQVELEPVDLRRADGVFVLSEGEASLTIRSTGADSVTIENVSEAQLVALADARNMLTKEGWVGLGPGTY